MNIGRMMGAAVVAFVVIEGLWIAASLTFDWGGDIFQRIAGGVAAWISLAVGFWVECRLERRDRGREQW